MALLVVVVAGRGRDDPAGDVRALDRAWQQAQATSRAADDASVRVRELLTSDGDAGIADALGAVRREERDRLTRLGRDVRDVTAHRDLVRVAQDAVERAVTLRERRAVAAAAYYASGRTGVSLVPGLDPAIERASRRADEALATARSEWDLRVAAATTPRFASLDRVVAALGPVTDVPVRTRLLLSTDHGLVVFDPDATSGGIEVLDLRTNPAEFVARRTFVAVSHAGFRPWELRFLDDPRRTVPIPGSPVTASDGGLWSLQDSTATKLDADGRPTFASVTMFEGWQPIAEVGGAFVLLSTGRVDRTSFRLWRNDGSLDRAVDGFPLAWSGDLLAWIRCDQECDIALTNVRTGAEHHVAPPDADRWSVERAAFSPDGRWLALTTSDATGAVVLVDAATLTAARVPVPVTSPPGPLSWSPDSGRLFVVTTGDRIAWFSLADRRPHLIQLRPAFRDAVRAFDLAVLGASPGAR